MVEFTPDAAKLRDDYLHQVRTCMGAAQTADPDEIARDLSEHLELELQDAKQPVSERALQDVLERLGSPDEWVSEDDLPWWRQIMVRLRGGPEDWRLAYLSFGVLIVGTALFGVLGIVGGFLLSRAAVEEPPHRRLSPGKKWLIYPPLLVVYVPLAAVVFGWPFYFLSGWFRPVLDFVRPSFHPSDLPEGIARLAFSAAGLFLWWGLLYFAMRWRPGCLRTVFRPFANAIKPEAFGRAVRGAGWVALALTGATVLVSYLTSGLPALLTQLGWG
jgi:hypothetical protein